MAQILDTIVVDVLDEVVQSMKVTGKKETLIGIEKIHFDAGRNGQILQKLNDFDGSINYKGYKYPIIAVIAPFREDVGGGYIKVKFDRIVIATHENGTDGTKRYMDKYKAGGTFKSILYPIYNRFFVCLGLHPLIVGMEPKSFVHTKVDNPGEQPLGQGSTDYVDTIEILNLELLITQFKTCK